MGNIRNDVFLGTIEVYNKKLADLANLAQDEVWSFGKDKERDPYKILRNYFQFTYNRLVDEDKIITSADGTYRCMNTGLLTKYNQEIVAIFSKNLRKGAAQPWYFNGVCKETDKFFTSKFSNVPEIADYFENPSDLIYDKKLEIVLKKEHIIEDNFERFVDAGYTDKTFIDICLEFSKTTLKKRLARDFKLALPFYYHNTETDENKMQLLVPLYFPGDAPVKLALVLNKITSEATSYYEGVTVLPVALAYMNSRLIVRPEEEWARIIDDVDNTFNYGEDDENMTYDAKNT